MNTKAIPVDDVDMDKFWSKVDKTSDCWNWIATEEGYGNYSINGKSFLAHRVSYAIHRGSIEPGMMVLHSCDNPRCVNPDHLRQGDQSENMIDRAKRGNHGKLTEQDVLEIRRQFKDGVPHTLIARTYDITEGHVHMIASGRSWAHADGPLTRRRLLTPEQVREIRRKYATGKYKQKDLGKEYGLKQHSISEIVHGKKWKHVE